MRRVTLGVFGGLLGAAVIAASGSGAGTHEHLSTVAPTAKIARLDSHLRTLRTADARVEIMAASPTRARSLVIRRGGRVEGSYGRLIEAVVPVASLRSLARSRDIRSVRSPSQPVAEAVRGQGVGTTGASAWQKAGAGGAGVKIAVVDLGFQDWRRSQANGDLPASVVKADFCPAGGFEATSHGTAVAEIVSEMAPDAKLYLVCAQTVAALGRAVEYAKAQGITIVNHSVSWFNTSRGDGTGAADTPEGIVATARAAGILWVNAAGNRAQQHWSGTFTMRTPTAGTSSRPATRGTRSSSQPAHTRAQRSSGTTGP